MGEAAVSAGAVVKAAREYREWGIWERSGILTILVEVELTGWSRLYDDGMIETCGRAYN